MRNGRGIALGGFMGVGKSRVGQAVAAAMGWPFEDTDRLLVERYGPISRQFEQEGEPTFRVREREIVRELTDGRQRVLATGGGVWADPTNRSVLRQGYHLVVIHAPIDVLRERVQGANSRPLWDDQVEALYAARQPHYADADFHVETGNGPVADVVREILTWLKSQ